MKNWMLSSVSLCAVMVTITVIAASESDTPQHASAKSIFKVKGESVRVRLVDASSGNPIALADVAVRSDNGIRCIQAPCPINWTEWKGKTNGAGYVDVPTRTFQTVTTIDAASYEAAPMTDAQAAPGGTWIVEMVEKRVLDPPGESIGPDFWPGYQPVKLIDGSNGHPIVNAWVHVVSAKTVRFDLKTNALGYVFLPNDKVMRLGDIDRTTITVPGFRRTILGVGGAGRRVILQKR